MRADFKGENRTQTDPGSQSLVPRMGIGPAQIVTFITNIMEVLSVLNGVPCCKLDNEELEARIMDRKTKNHCGREMLLLLVKEPSR